jgi:hypothetical protein
MQKNSRKRAEQEADTRYAVQSARKIAAGIPAPLRETSACFPRESDGAMFVCER